MQSIRDRAAFITGGASGIGLGMARVLLDAGMRVMIADVRPEALDAATAALGADAARLHAMVLDVSDRDAMYRAAEKAESILGPIHLLCNNAGVGMLGDVRTTGPADWDWCLSVNLGGVVNGVLAFLPRMLAHGQGGHIVNTSSIGAISPGPGAIAYLTAKGAVVTLSECLRIELAGSGVSVTVLIPGPTRSNIHHVAELRPPHLRDGPLSAFERSLAERPLFGNGLDPVEVGGMVLDAVERDLMYVFTHNEFREGTAQRFEAILDAFPRDPIDPERAKGFGFPLVNPLFGELLRRREPPAAARPRSGAAKRGQDS